MSGEGISLFLNKWLFAFLSFEPNIEISLKMCALTLYERGELSSKWELNVLPAPRGRLLLSESDACECRTFTTITAYSGRDAQVTLGARKMCA